MSMAPNNFAIVSKGSSVEDVRAVIKGKKTKKYLKITCMGAEDWLWCRREGVREISCPGG